VNQKTLKMNLQKLMSNYAAYNLWANQTLVNWLKTKPVELLDKEIPSSFPSVLKTLNHIWAVEEFWHAVVTVNKPTSSRYMAQNMDTDEILNGLPQQSQTLADYVKTLSEAGLQQNVLLDTPWAKGEQPRYEFLQHVFNHSTYHRGQAITIGRNLGFTDAPMTDYNYYNMVFKK
jgi:uncharacterized damage-inducible protein DinB